MATAYIHTFTVYPRGEEFTRFPLDMLRYDGVFPVHENEARHLGDDTYWKVQPDSMAQRRVTLRKVSTEKSWRPTQARWASFGWLISEMSHEVHKVP